ncbi:MAG: FtsX-like permease family protein, partial [Desulfohalobiaceae bacterium]
QGVLSLKENMVQGSVEALTESRDFPGVLIGKEMALRLGLTVDSTLNLLSPSGSKSAAGFSPEVRTVEVVGIFDTGMFEYDSSLAYVDLKTAQDLLGFSGDKVNGLEVRLGDVYAAKGVADAVEERLGGYPFYARDWMEMNENLFSALQLEKTAMFVILVMIVLVGSFSIITTLVMLVMEKTRDIAILISMGARPENIKRIFMLQGTIIGAVGTSLGYVLGLGISMLLKRYQFIELPKDVYYLDRLPVRLEWLDMSLIGIAAMALCFLATLYPASQAANLQPAEALRYE